MDQAQSLRNMMNMKQQGDVPQTSARVITVTSGKGGVGKTNFTVNLACWLAKQGTRVSIIDADFGLANIEVLFNVWPKHSIADVIRGVKSVEEIVQDAPLGIKFISGGTGFKDLANLTDSQISQVLNSFSYLDEISDIILIDTGAGISKTVTAFVKASSEALVITTPEPTSISDSYTLIKAVSDTQSRKNGQSPQIGIVLNRADNEKEGTQVYERLRSVCEKFIGIAPDYLGCLMNDSDLIKAVKQQKPVLISYPSSVYSRGIDNLGRKIIKSNIPTERIPERTGILAFMRRIITRG